MAINVTRNDHYSHRSWSWANEDTMIVLHTVNSMILFFIVSLRRSSKQILMAICSLETSSMEKNKVAMKLEKWRRKTNSFDVSGGRQNNITGDCTPEDHPQREAQKKMIISEFIRSNILFDIDHRVGLVSSACLQLFILVLWSGLFAVSSITSLHSNKY